MTPPIAPRRRPQLVRDHGSSSSTSLSGMEKPVQSFQSFSNSSITYMDKPLPSVPRRPSSIYSQEEQIIDSYASRQNPKDLTYTTAIYLQPATKSSSISKLPFTETSRPPLAQKYNPSSISLNTDRKLSKPASRLVADCATNERQSRRRKSPLSPTLKDMIAAEEEIDRLDAQKWAEEHQALLTSASTLGTSESIASLSPSMGQGHGEVNGDPANTNGDLVPMPSPAVHRESSEQDRPVSHFSLNSEPEDTKISFLAARDSFLARIPKPIKHSKTDHQEDALAPVAVAMGGKGSRSATNTERNWSTTTEENPTLQEKVTHVYSKYLGRATEIRNGTHLPRSEKLAMDEKIMKGPRPFHPSRSPPSPLSPTAEVVSAVHIHGAQVRSTLCRARRCIVRTKSEKRRDNLRSQIVVIRKTAPHPDDRVIPWM
ncbi:MAG: hypothetical protein M1827_004325 [Pycnora praestabilis]|nr:MAG: hypothetical protein M1827_004325 [Pycnora praestabilis]